MYMYMYMSMYTYIYTYLIKETDCVCYVNFTIFTRPLGPYWDVSSKTGRLRSSKLPSHQF